MTDFKHGDIVSSAGGDLYRVEHAHFDGLRFVVLVPSAISQERPPVGAVLLRRDVDGEPLPVVDLTNGDLTAVKP